MREKEKSKAWISDYNTSEKLPRQVEPGQDRRVENNLRIKEKINQ